LYPAGDFLGLRLSGPRPQFIDPPRDFSKRVPRHGPLDQAKDIVKPPVGEQSSV
jgi:hypothetical protein